jgi:hypothetical protein
MAHRRTAIASLTVAVIITAASGAASTSARASILSDAWNGVTNTLSTAWESVSSFARWTAGPHANPYTGVKPNPNMGVKPNPNMGVKPNPNMGVHPAGGRQAAETAGGSNACQVQAANPSGSACGNPFENDGNDACFDDRTLVEVCSDTSVTFIRCRQSEKCAQGRCLPGSQQEECGPAFQCMQ